MAEVATRFAGLKDETIRLEEEKAIAQFRKQLVNVLCDHSLPHSSSPRRNPWIIV